MVYVPWQYQRLTEAGRPIWTSLNAEETAELQRLARGRRCLEVGSAFGWSAIAMSLAGAESVTAVDLHEPHVTNEQHDTLPEMVTNLRAYGAKGVRILQRHSHDMLPELASHSHTRFGLVFIDGDHEEKAVREDAYWAHLLLTHDGVLACHDYGNDNTPGVKAALDALFPDGPTRVARSLWVLET